MLVSVVNIIHWYYLFLTCNISLKYMENREKEKKLFKKDKRSRYLVPFVKPCWCCDAAVHESLKDEGNIFVTECKSQTEKRDKLRGHRFISFECKQKRTNIIKYIFVKPMCKYPHVQELECWSYLLSRHGIFVCYLHAVHYFVVIFILYLCLLKQVTVSGF